MSIKKLQHAIAKRANKYTILYIEIERQGSNYYEPILLKDPAPLNSLNSVCKKFPTAVHCMAISWKLKNIKYYIGQTHKAAKLPAHEPQKTPLPNKKKG